LYDEYGEPQSPYINIANDDPREDPGKQSRVSRDPIPFFFLSRGEHLATNDKSERDASLPVIRTEILLNRFHRLGPVLVGDLWLISDGWIRGEASFSRSRFVMHWDHEVPSINASRAPMLFHSIALLLANNGRRPQDTLLRQMFTAIPGLELIYRLQNSILLHNDLPFAMGISQETDSLGLDCSYHPVQGVLGLIN
jgi:hypothetical protein